MLSTNTDTSPPSREISEGFQIVGAPTDYAYVEPVFSGMNPHSLFVGDRYKGEPQDNIVLRCLQRAAAHGDECVAGFCAVLSDHCSNVDASGAISPKFHMRATERKIKEGNPPTCEQVLREASRPKTEMH